MTNTRKLEILWDLYFIAVGLDTLMTRREILKFNDGYDSWLPVGICDAIILMCDVYIDIDEVLKPPKRKTIDDYWWPLADWHIRSKALLKAIKKVSNEISNQ